MLISLHFLFTQTKVTLGGFKFKKVMLLGHYVHNIDKDAATVVL